MRWIIVAGSTTVIVATLAIIGLRLIDAVAQPERVGPELQPAYDSLISGFGSAVVLAVGGIGIVVVALLTFMARTSGR